MSDADQLQRRVYRRGLRIQSRRATRAVLAGTVGGLCGAVSLGLAVGVLAGWWG